MKLHNIHSNIPEIYTAFLQLYDVGPILEAAWPQEWSDTIIQSKEFKDWLNALKIDGNIGLPLAGGVGRAYPIGDKYIIKFTTDRKEASAAAIIKGHDSPNAATIYDVKFIKSFKYPDSNRKSDLYAIAMERLSTGVGKRYRVAANSVYNYLDHNPGFINDPEKVSQIVINSLPNAYKNDEATINAVHNIINGLYDIQKKTGVLSQDPHGGNIGFKGRNPGFFDFGRSNINYDHPKSSGVKITNLT